MHVHNKSYERFFVTPSKRSMLPILNICTKECRSLVSQTTYVHICKACYLRFFKYLPPVTLFIISIKFFLIFFWNIRIAEHICIIACWHLTSIWTFHFLDSSSALQCLTNSFRRTLWILFFYLYFIFLIVLHYRTLIPHTLDMAEPN